MNNEVSEILKNLINENGVDLCNNKIKLQGLLFDLCGESKKEINILIIVMQQGIAQEILDIAENAIDDFTYSRLVNRVCEESGTAKKPTLWAVKCWIEALGKELNPSKGNIPIYLDHLYIGPLNESILKIYSFESLSQYVARIENMQCVAFGKAKLIKRNYDMDDVIFPLEVKWDKWLKHRDIVNENWKLSITVDRTIATSLYNSSKEFPINGKLQVVDGSIKIKDASIVALGKVFGITFNEDKPKIEDKAILIKALGQWNYYCSETDGYKIYKVKTDGTCKTLVSKDRTLNINIIEDWIFYSNGSDYFKIYKIKIDGSQKSIVSEDVTGNLKLIGEWIYYTNYLDKCKTYKIKIDGTGKSEVNEDEEVEI